MQDGDVYRVRAIYGFSREAEQYALENPLRPSRGNMTGRVALEGKAVHIPDVLADPEYTATDYQKASAIGPILVCRCYAREPRSALLQLVKKARILNGDHRLIGEGAS